MFMNIEKITDLVVNITSSKKKIRIDDKEIKSIVRTIFLYLNFFNTFDEFTLSYDGRLFSDIKVLNEFAPWILPLSVRIDPSNIRTQDLLIRPDPMSNFNYSYEEYVRACNNFRRIFKSDDTHDYTDLNSLRKHISLAEAIPHMTVKFNSNGKDVWLVDYDNTAFIPIPINDSVSLLFRNDYFNADADNIVTDYINYMSIY